MKEGIEEMKATVHRIEDLARKTYDLLKEDKHTSSVKTIYHHYRMLMEQNESVSGKVAIVSVYGLSKRR